MSSPTIIRQEPRGTPAIGFQFEVPGEVEVNKGPTIVCRELRHDGRLVGELEASVFSAALVIDRDGILAEKASDVLGTAIGRLGGRAVPVVLPGARGFRADAVVREPLPYVYVFALAPADLGIDGGVLIAIRCAPPDWPAAEHALRTLRILTRSGRISTNFDAEDGPLLPVVAPSRE